MPKNYKELTSEEKKVILERHSEIIQKLNAHLPDHLKLKEDKSLAKRLEDKDEVKAYRIVEEIKEKHTIQDRDYNDSTRAFAPLKQTEDSVLVDSSDMTIEEVANFMLSKIKV